MNTATRRAPAHRPWTHYVNDAFFDRPDLEPNLERLAFRLERLARDKPWCLTSNDQLRDLLGCSRNTLAALLSRGEALGWFRRALVPGRHGRATGRLGIVLFVRPTDRPVATPQTFDQAVDQMRAELARDRGPTRSRTLPFPAPMPRESGTAVPRNGAPTVPRNWAPSPCSKEETIQETTTTAAAGSSSSSTPARGPESGRGGHPEPEVPRHTLVPEEPAAGAPTRPIGLPPAPGSPVREDLPTELATAAAAAMPGASREWLAGLLRDCGAYGLDLALLVVAWVQQRRPQKPARYARVALSGWLNRLRSGEMTLSDVRAEVEGGSGPPASSRRFDPAACLARMACDGWALVPEGADRVKWTGIPGRDPTEWRRIHSDLRQQVAEHRAELKAYVLSRAMERRKAAAHRE